MFLISHLLKLSFSLDFFSYIYFLLNDSSLISGGARINVSLESKNQTVGKTIVVCHLYKIFLLSSSLSQRCHARSILQKKEKPNLLEKMCFNMHTLFFWFIFCFKYQKTSM